MNFSQIINELSAFLHFDLSLWNTYYGSDTNPTKYNKNETINDPGNCFFKLLKQLLKSSLGSAQTALFELKEIQTPNFLFALLPS